MTYAGPTYRAPAWPAPMPMLAGLMPGITARTPAIPAMVHPWPYTARPIWSGTVRPMG